jgi:DnaK suppressor protein
MSAKRKSETKSAKKSKTVAKSKVTKPAPKKAAAKKAPSKKGPATKAAPSARESKTPKKRPAAPAKVVKRKQPGLDLERFRARLRERQAELVRAYLNAKGDSRSRESDGTEDYIDYAVSSYDREFLLSLTELEQTELRLVGEALQRVDSGQFGLCVQCERPIATRRLDVQPWARYCLRCQELADSGLAAGSIEFPSEDEEVAVVEEGFDDEFAVDDDSDDDEDVGEDRLSGA